MSEAAATIDSGDRAQAERMLRIAGIAGPFALHPVPGGRNNRTARLTTPSGDYFLKRYADNPADGRDRLRSETAFCRFARSAGIDTVPELLAADAATRTALFAFVPGRPMPADGADEASLSQAVEFAVALNRRRAAGAALPDASEAAFSLDAHAASIRDRFESLRRHVEDGDASAYLRTEVGPALERIDCRGSQVLTAGERCISPSDFGFHNAVVAAGGRLRFVDFEYAGWDDPARMVCDFFLQVAVPVPARFLRPMAEALAPHFGDPAAFRRRIARLMPLYHVKWCCLLLNDFHPHARARRAFAGIRLDADHLGRQLALARARLADRAAVLAAEKLAGQPA